MKKCEFVRLCDGKGGRILAFVEAKSSVPRETNKGDFERYITDVCQKFGDTVDVFNALVLKRKTLRDSRPFPPALRITYQENLRYQLTLIIQGSQPDWLPAIKYALVMALRPLLNKWNILDSDVLVLNETLARSKKLIA